MSFANALLPHLLPPAAAEGAPAAADAPSAVIGLVPCAVGGTAIREWEKGAALYEAMVRRAREAVASDGDGDGDGEGGEIKAVLWYQGESDTDSNHEAEAYGSNLEQLVRNIRSDLGLPMLPIIQVAIASGAKHQYVEKVREAQLGLNMHNVVCVDAKGLPLNDDKLHLSTAAQVLLGHKLADAYVNNFLALSH